MPSVYPVTTPKPASKASLAYEQKEEGRVPRSRFPSSYFSSENHHSPMEVPRAWFYRRLREQVCQDYGEYLEECKRENSHHDKK